MGAGGGKELVPSVEGSEGREGDQCGEGKHRLGGVDCG